MKKLLALILLISTVAVYSQDNDENIVRFETKKTYVTKYLDKDSVVITPKVKKYHYFVIYNPINPSIDKHTRYLMLGDEKVVFDAHASEDNYEKSTIYEKSLKEMVEEWKDTVYGKGILEKVVWYKKSKFMFYYVSNFKKNEIKTDDKSDE